ncbi:MAG: hypothetical protein IKE28_09685 [Solobacterium sp.]|nr:hypothetical protein [Solobacterium sp.]
MNTFLKAQIDNMINTLKVFETGCELAALQDDGVVDKKEDKALKKLKKATAEYIKTLQSIEY